MQDSLDKVVTSIRSSQMLRLFFVGFLVLLLQIPILMIDHLVSERRSRRDAAVVEVSSKSGAVQSITGPALVVPFTHQWTETLPDGKQLLHSDKRNQIILPDRLQLKGTVSSNTLKRGIFSVPVYKLGLTVEGEFARPSIPDLGTGTASIDWDHVHLAVGISDTRAIQEETAVTWNDKRVPFLPGTRDFKEGGTGIHAVVGVPDAAERITFSFPLSLNGSTAVNMVPFAQNTTVELSGNYGHPSFQGNWLPMDRTVTRDSFQAKWNIPFLGRGYPQSWTSEASAPGVVTEMQKAINASRFGVELANPVDHYRMAARSVKYAALFILLTFAAVWLIEVLAGVRVHSIQYLMLGGALCVFYLLELSMSEHFGFPLAYIVASAAVVTLVGGYGKVVLRSAPRGVGVAAGVATLYAYLYLLLMNEDYALLIGSIGLFAMLAAIMYATRRVDWNAVGGKRVASVAP